MPNNVKVFISWSGVTSNRVALVLKDWLEDVIQDLDCFVSTHMEKGQAWAATLTKELAGSKYGIFCVTPSNKMQPWLNFEAGAISTQVASRVSPFLLNMPSAELQFPLAQYQATTWDNKEDVLRLLKGINLSASDEPMLSEMRLERNFNREWDRLHSSLKRIAEGAKAEDVPSAPPVNKQEKMMEEMLESMRAQQRMLTAVAGDLLRGSSNLDSDWQRPLWDSTGSNRDLLFTNVTRRVANEKAEKRVAHFLSEALVEALRKQNEPTSKNEQEPPASKKKQGPTDVEE